MSVTKCLTVKGEGAEVWTGTRAMPPPSGQPRRGLTQELGASVGALLEVIFDLPSFPSRSPTVSFQSNQRK